MSATCPAGPLEALAAAHKAGVQVSLDDGRLLLEAPDLPSDLVDLLAANKPGLLALFAGRNGAKSALEAAPPPDCLEHHWIEAQRGLRLFVTQGWADQAALFGWTVEELYRVPALWSQIHLCGAAWLVGERRVIAVTEASIVIETRSTAQQKFRRVGREHIA